MDQILFIENRTVVSEEIWIKYCSQKIEQQYQRKIFARTLIMKAAGINKFDSLMNGDRKRHTGTLCSLIESYFDQVGKYCTVYCEEIKLFLQGSVSTLPPALQSFLKPSNSRNDYPFLVVQSSKKGQIVVQIVVLKYDFTDLEQFPYVISVIKSLKKKTYKIALKNAQKSPYLYSIEIAVNNHQKLNKIKRNKIRIIKILKIIEMKTATKQLQKMIKMSNSNDI